MTTMKSLILASATILALSSGLAMADQGQGSDARPYFQASTVTTPADASQYRAAVHTHEMDIEAAGTTNFYNNGAEARDGGNR